MYAIENYRISNQLISIQFFHFHSIKFSSTNEIDLHNRFSNLFIPIKLISQNFPSLIIQKKKRIIIHSTTRIITHVSLSSKKKRKEKKREADNQDWERPLTDCPRSRSSKIERDSGSFTAARRVCSAEDFGAKLLSRPFLSEASVQAWASSPRHARCRK